MEKLVSYIKEYDPPYFHIMLFNSLFDSFEKIAKSGVQLPSNLRNTVLSFRIGVFDDGMPVSVMANNVGGQKRFHIADMPEHMVADTGITKSTPTTEVVISLMIDGEDAKHLVRSARKGLDSDYCRNPIWNERVKSTVEKCIEQIKQKG